MVDLDEIERRASACECSKVKVCTIRSSALLELVERTRQAEKDAARWRKLADSPDSSLTLRIHNSRCDQRDKVIDEAMK